MAGVAIEPGQIEAIKRVEDAVREALKPLSADGVTVAEMLIGMLIIVRQVITASMGPEYVVTWLRAQAALAEEAEERGSEDDAKSPTIN